MKHPLAVFALVVACTLSLLACEKSEAQISSTNDTGSTADSTQTNGTKMKIRIGTRTFEATLEASPTGNAFKELLPMTLKMSELNQNEKYADLNKSLPTKAINPDQIKSGDLLLYGSKTVVLFYKTFNTSYSYTRIGSITDASGLADAVGDKDVTVRFE